MRVAAKVVWRADRERYYLVDYHPAHANGRRVVALGPDDADRQRGQKIADSINLEREQAGNTRVILTPDGPLPAAAAIEAWWAAARPGMAESTRATVPYLIRHLEAELGAVNLRQLGREDVRAFGGALADHGRSQATVRDALSILRRVLNWCVEPPQNYLARLPLRGIVALGVSAAAARGARAPERVPFSYTEADTLLELATSQPELWLVLVLARNTGARKGELLALRWPRVNFSARRLTFAESLSRRTLRPKSTKSNRIRETEIPDPVVALLQQLARDRFGSDPFGLDVDEPILVNRSGRPWSETGLDSAWKRLRRRGLARGVRPLPFHAWRHTYVSWALAAGRNPAWIAEQIGDRVETLLRHYAHLVPGQSGDLDFLNSPGSHERSAHPSDPEAAHASVGLEDRSEAAVRPDRRTSRRTSGRRVAESSSGARSSSPRARRP